MSGLRCFVGVPLPACIADPVLRACSAVKRTDRSWSDEKWVAPENLHLTLEFLGTLPESSLPDLRAALGAAVVVLPRFELPFSGLAAAPGSRRARMLWATFLDPDGACARLAEAIERAALPFGVEAETRAFRPHVTLCRARRPHAVSDQALLAATDALEGAPEFMSVPSVSLFSSRLTPRGPIYTEIDTWRMRGD